MRQSLGLAYIGKSQLECSVRTTWQCIERHSTTSTPQDPDTAISAFHHVQLTRSCTHLYLVTVNLPHSSIAQCTRCRGSKNKLSVSPDDNTCPVSTRCEIFMFAPVINSEEKTTSSIQLQWEITLVRSPRGMRYEEFYKLMRETYDKACNWRSL